MTETEKSILLSKYEKIKGYSSSLEIGGKCQVFDGQAWMKKGDIGNNECYYVDATILSVGRTEYNEIIVDVKITNGRLSHGHYLEGVRSHCA